MEELIKFRKFIRFRSRVQEFFCRILQYREIGHFHQFGSYTWKNSLSPYIRIRIRTRLGGGLLSSSALVCNRMMKLVNVYFVNVYFVQNVDRLHLGVSTWEL